MNDFQSACSFTANKEKRKMELDWRFLRSLLFFSNLGLMMKKVRTIKKENCFNKFAGGLLVVSRTL